MNTLSIGLNKTKSFLVNLCPDGRFCDAVMSAGISVMIIGCMLVSIFGLL